MFSIEETDGVHFLTMRLVEGQPLDRLIPEGGLPAQRILKIAKATLSPPPTTRASSIAT